MPPTKRPPRLTIDALIKQRRLFDVKGAAYILGYNAQHLRRLCKAGKVACTRRGPRGARRKRYYFNRRQVRALISYQVGQLL